MKVFFVITGIGLGHAIREEAIMQELKKRGDVEIRIASFHVGYQYFRNRFPTSKLWGHRFPDATFRFGYLSLFFANILYPLYWLHDVIILRRRILEFSPHIIIVDAEPVGAFVGHLLSRKVATIYNLDLEAWRFYRTKKWLMRIQSLLYKKIIRRCYELSDVVIIPSIVQRRRGKVYSVPPILRSTPETLSSERTLRKRLQVSNPILVMLGGSRFGFQLVEQLSSIAQRFHEEFIVFGYYKPMIQDRKGFRVLGFRENYLEYLKVCKAVLIISGHNALTEAIVYKKPALVFPIPGFTEHYLNVFQNPYVKTYYADKLNTAVLLQVVTKFIRDIPHLQQYLDKHPVPGDGAARSVDIMLDQL